MSAPLPTRLSLPECRAVFAELQDRIADHSAAWDGIREAAFARHGISEGLLTRIDQQFLQDVERLQGQVSPEHPYFVGEVVGGIRFLGDARDFPSVLHAVDPTCNSTVIDALAAELDRRPGDLVDVGANLGVLATRLARHLGPGHRVFSFEPSPETAKLTASTIALNDVENVVLLDQAVGDVDGAITFHTTPGNSAIASARHHAFGLLNEWVEVTVPAVRLDTLHAEGLLDDVTVVKIDVEGHELGVLRGAAEFFRAVRPTVVYEYTPVAAADHGWTQEQTVELLSEVGQFTFEAVPEDGGPVLPFPLPEDYAGQVNVFARPVGTPAGAPSPS